MGWIIEQETGKLPKIPSEYLEPYLQRFISQEIEAVAYGFRSPAEMKNNIKVLQTFTSRFGGIHSTLAMANEVERIERLEDWQLWTICKKVWGFLKDKSC